MKIIIEKPHNISDSQLEAILTLINSGGEVNMQGLKNRLLNADLVAIGLDKNQIFATATIKNPHTEYRDKVFTAAEVEEQKDRFVKELGYIVTHTDYEGRKLCQTLLVELLPHIESHEIFATTRKPAMIHILSKIGFKKVGKTYNKDLNLLIRNGKK